MLYLLTDVLLLADVITAFRESCLEYYKLDPVYYYTLPNFSWDAMLKMTGIEFELLTDIDMYTMIERGIRGGISVASKKYAKANNPYLTDYDSSQETNYYISRC